MAALGSMGLTQWLRHRQENDPWRNAVRWSDGHPHPEAQPASRSHLEAAQRYSETAEVRLRMAKYEKMAANSFQAEAKRLKP